MYSIEMLTEAVNQSQCWSDVCRQLNVTICTFNFKRAQKLCGEHNISYEHFDIKKTFRRGKKNWNAEEVYCAKSTFPRCYLRQRVLADKFLPYRCNSCGNEGEWRGQLLTLEIEHINGINDDNQKHNLTWLCPNCHSQTPTFRNRKNREGLVA